MGRLAPLAGVDRTPPGQRRVIGGLFGLAGPCEEVIVYGIAKRVAFKPRPDFRLIVAEMTVSR
jgi:hypothetical protein